jgi:hypothetical protein
VESLSDHFKRRAAEKKALKKARRKASQEAQQKGEDLEWEHERTRRLFRRYRNGEQ